MNTAVILLVVVLVAMVVIGGYFFYRRKQQGGELTQLTIKTKNFSTKHDWDPAAGTNVL